MQETWGKRLGRFCLRWYLDKFPLRDGKAFFYRLLHEKLTPAVRFQVERLSPGFVMNLDLKDPEQRKLYFYGHYHERYEARLIERVLTAGEVFWDVGANIGYFSLIAAQKLGNTGQVAAFEPGSEAFARLVENLALNSFTSVHPFQVAVADQEGEAVLHLSKEVSDSGASLYRPRGEASRQEVCRVVSLDAFSRDQLWARPTLVKIDVEGAELAVLQGARQVLEHCRPLLLVELEAAVLIAVGRTKTEVQEFLRPFGYQAAFLHKGRWQCIAEVERARGRNIFWYNPDIAAHRDKAAMIPILISEQ